MNYGVKDMEMVPGRRGGICVCANTVREAVCIHIFQVKKQNKTQNIKKTQQISVWNQKWNREK